MRIKTMAGGIRRTVGGSPVGEGIYGITLLYTSMISHVSCPACCIDHQQHQLPFLASGGEAG